ncbi:MAG: purine/pyrimidine permease [Spirochaetes bacterium]|nr:purine/pyrimidine permease [Spirochaetota bacterium]
MADQENNAQITTLAIGVDDKLSVGENIIYGLQHVFVLILAPLITPIIFASVFQWDINITAYLVMIMILGAGIETTIQARILKLPVAQAQHIVFIAAMISAIFALGPVPVWWGLVIVSAITILLVIPFKKGLIGQLLPFLATPVVIGPLFVVMGVSLTKAACIDLIFPMGPEGVIIDKGAFILAMIAVAVPVLVSFFIPKGVGRYGCILWGVLAATIVAIFMGRVDFARVAEAPWFMAPKFFTKIFEGNMGRPLKLSWNFIPAVLILFIAEISNITDTIGCYQATAKLVGQKLTKERTNRGLFVETAASLVTTLFGNIPCTSFSQNLGVLSLSRVGAKSIIVAGGIIMIGIGLIYKVAVFFAVIPWAIYGGAMIILLGTIILVGVQMILAMEMTETKKLIAGFAIILGMCFTFMPPSVTQTLPLILQFFIGNPIGSTVLMAIVLNLIFVVGLKSPGK